MNIKNNNGLELGEATINPVLNKYDGVVLFPEQLAVANKMLTNTNFVEAIVKKDKRE